MRIADSTVNMLSGRNYTQTGMRSGSGYTNGPTRTTVVWVRITWMISDISKALEK